jgi:hypothetical protein
MIRVNGTVRKLSTIFLLLSCGGNVTQAPATVCAPGQQIECACAAGAKGAQPCKDDGSGYERCDCSGGSGGAAGSMSLDASNGGAGGEAGSGGAPAFDAELDRFADSERDAMADIPGIDVLGPCTSGVRWTGGDAPSPLMTPGKACMNSGCHSSTSKTKMTLGGTVYPLKGGYDDDDCNGLDSTMVGAAIEIVDVDGTPLAIPRVPINPVGNFHADRPLPSSFRVKLHSQGRTAEKMTPVSNGDCNYCHRQDDFMGAKGRIVPASQ